MGTQDGVWAQLRRESYTINVGQVYTLKIVSKEGWFYDFYIDNTIIMEDVHDDTFKIGSIGLRTLVSTATYYSVKYTNLDS